MSKKITNKVESESVLNEEKEQQVVVEKKLKISDISGMNRGNINLSLGGLNSVAFLSQDQIKEIFEDPNTAQKTISNYFLKIKNIDKTNLEKIIKLGKKIKPYNKDFKNITSNILAIKKFDNYNYSNHIQLDYTDIKSEFQTIENSINNLIEYVGETKLNTKKLIIEKDNFITLKDYYINLITLYNNMIDNKEIIIEIDKMVCKIRDLMQITLYYNGIVCRQKLAGNIILMIYQIDFRMVFIEPFRFLATGNEMYFPNPRGKFVNTPEPILQKAVIPETGIRNTILCIALFPGMLFKFKLPFGVIHINPCNHKIYIHALVLNFINRY